MRLLRIDSSARGHSVSRQFTSEFVKSWKEQNPDGKVVERDLARTPLPHITDDWMTIFSDQSGLTPQQQAYFSISNELIDELLGSDIVVIGSPMHNFTVSWELKAWIDQVVRLGRTNAVNGESEWPVHRITGAGNLAGLCSVRQIGVVYASHRHGL